MICRHVGSLKAHLHGIPEVVSVLRNEAIAHVSGMQSSCKGHNNIIACSASCNKHKVKDDFFFLFFYFYNNSAKICKVTQSS